MNFKQMEEEQTQKITMGVTIKRSDIKADFHSVIIQTQEVINTYERKLKSFYNFDKYSLSSILQIKKEIREHTEYLKAVIIEYKILFEGDEEALSHLSSILNLNAIKEDL